MNLQILQGDCLSMLRTLQAESIQTCVTSPPYFGLRDYDSDGQIGLERTPDEYVAKMVQVFREVRRVLRKDGTVFLNLGDSYATGAGGVGKCPGGGKQGESWKMRGKMTPPNRMPLPGLKPKDLIGIPWKVAFALQADGWWLRQDIIWSKGNPMPESVRDRCTKSHEYIFLLSKSEKYYFDSDAIKEPAKFKDGPRNTRPMKAASSGHNNLHKIGPRDTRNRRSVWTVNTKPFRGAHFATFPQDLIEPCILAGAPKGGTVLDPFFGAGTTGLVALKHERSCVGIELNPAYVEIAKKRIGSECQISLGI